MKKITFLIFFLTTITAQAQEVFYNVLDYGAKADGKTLNTIAIQKAIDECTGKSGGTVVFPAGTYLSGTIILKDNVILNLQAGSKILGSTNINDYPMYSPPVPNNMDKDIKRALIRAENSTNIGITGQGTIDGQGAKLQHIKIDDEVMKEVKKIYTDKTRYIPTKKNDQRPFLIRFVNCKNILMEGITLQHPAKWTQHYLDCDGVTIRDVKVFAHGGENNDMVDIDGSRNVVITGLNGDSDDDGICLKSTGNQIVENVLISDCILRSRTNPIKTGTDSYGGFRNITITNCYIGPSLTNDGYSGRKEGLAGIALELVDGGVLENITISNITMDEMAAPVFIRLGNRGRTPKPDMKSRPAGVVNNINISNIISKNAGRTGCSIIGELGHPISNVSISNVKINFDGGGTLAEASAEKPELVNEYPECVSLGKLPAYGFFVRHVDGITFNNVTFSYNEEDYRPAMLFDDVKNLKILNFDTEIADDAKGQIILQNASGIFVNGCSPQNSNTFLVIEQNSKNINITGNNFSRMNKPLMIDESINTSEIKVSSNLTGASNLFEMLQPNISRDSLGVVSIYFPNNAKIHYTVVGSTPDVDSEIYKGTFKQIGAATIKAIAFGQNTQSRTAIIKFSQTQVLAPHIYPKDQFFYEVIKVSLKSNTKEATIYYTLDGSIPTTYSLKYTKPIAIKKDSKLRTFAIKDGYANSEETSSQYVAIDKKAGVQFRYYEMKLEKLPNFVYLKPAKTGTVDKFSTNEITAKDYYFAIVMQGFVTIKKKGDYTFYLASNDGSKLLVDNKEIIDNDRAHGTVEKSSAVHLKKGTHLIEVHYFQAGGGKSLKVSWEASGLKKREMEKKDFSDY